MRDTKIRLGPDGGTLLGIVFVVLKLTGVIGWSWWWVLAPFWVPAAIVLAVIGIALLIGAVFA